MCDHVCMVATRPCVSVPYKSFLGLWGLMSDGLGQVGSKSDLVSHIRLLSHSFFLFPPHPLECKSHSEPQAGQKQAVGPSLLFPGLSV